MAKGAGGTKTSNGNVKENDHLMFEHLSGTNDDDVLSKEESISLIMENNDIGYSEAEKYYNALQKYTEQNVADINTLEDFIKSSPKWYGDETFRAMDVSDEVLKQFKLGGTYTPGRLSSWSTDRYIAVDTFSGKGGNSVLLRSLTQPKGTSVVHASTIPADAEVLVSKSASYKIIDIEKEWGTTIVYLEPITKKVNNHGKRKW